MDGRLNTLFVRYGCGTNGYCCFTAERPSLNTLFVRYGCGTPNGLWSWGYFFVLIPYSSGMGVGPVTNDVRKGDRGLNTLFVRYGCGTDVVFFDGEAVGS